MRRLLENLVLLLVVLPLVGWLVLRRAVVQQLNRALVRFNRRIVEPDLKGRCGWQIVPVRVPPLTPEQALAQAVSDYETKVRVANFRELLRKV